MNHTHCRNMTDHKMVFLTGLTIYPGMSAILDGDNPAVKQLLERGSLIALPTFNVKAGSETMALVLAKGSCTSTLIAMMQRRLTNWIMIMLDGKPFDLVVDDQQVINARIDMLDYLTEMVTVGKIAMDGSTGLWGSPAMDSFNVEV